MKGRKDSELGGAMSPVIHIGLHQAKKDNDNNATFVNEL